MLLAGLRCVCLLLAGGLLATAYFLFFQRPRSPLAPASAILALLSCLCFLLAIMPRRMWSSLLKRTILARQRLAQVDLPDCNSAGVVLLVVAGICFVLIQSHFHKLQTNPRVNDPAAFLRYANEVADSGGPMALVRQLYSGTWEEANQHPLYVGLLSISPEYDAGKRLSSVIGGLALAATAALVAYRHSLLVAGVFAILATSNFAFLSQTSLVTCECLLILFVSVAWFILGMALEARATANRSRAWMLSAAAGGCLGLTYLAKGTGPIYLAPALLWLLLNYRQPAVSNERNANGNQEPARVNKQTPSVVSCAAILLVAWVIVASPLLRRNMIRYGQPIYNVNSYLLFADEFINPKQLALQKTMGEAACEYLAEHSLPDLLERETVGLVWESYIALRALGPTPLDDGRTLFGLLWLPMIVAGLSTDQRKGQWLLLLWWAASLLIFAWYIPIAAGERFIVPLILPTLVYVSLGLLRLSKMLLGPRTIVVVSATCLLWTIIWLTLTFAPTHLGLRFN